MITSIDKRYIIKPEQEQGTELSGQYIVQPTLLADYGTFRKSTSSPFIKYIFGFQIMPRKEVVNFAAHHWECCTEWSQHTRGVD